jgi:hypothetical protein
MRENLVQMIFFGSRIISWNYIGSSLKFHKNFLFSLKCRSIQFRNPQCSYFKPPFSIKKSNFQALDPFISTPNSCDHRIELGAYQNGAYLELRGSGASELRASEDFLTLHNTSIESGEFPKRLFSRASRLRRRALE